MCLLRCSLSFLYWWHLNTVFVMINKIFPHISRSTGNNPTVVNARQIRCSSFYNFLGIWMVFLGRYCLCWYSQWTHLPYRPAAFGITPNHARTSSNHPAFFRGRFISQFLKSIYLKIVDTLVTASQNQFQGMKREITKVLLISRIMDIIAWSQGMLRMVLYKTL